jgi:hypothetical protein
MCENGVIGGAAWSVCNMRGPLRAFPKLPSSDAIVIL